MATLTSTRNKLDNSAGEERGHEQNTTSVCNISPEEESWRVRAGVGGGDEWSLLMRTALPPLDIVKYHASSILHCGRIIRTQFAR